MAKVKVRVKKRSVQRLLEYLKGNWGAPFIIAFMILLAAAAAYLAIGMESLANDIAVYAYYNLVAGVVLQLISYVKESRGKSEEIG
jgi:hypothetical protein